MGKNLIDYRINKNSLVMTALAICVYREDFFPLKRESKMKHILNELFYIVYVSGKAILLFVSLCRSLMVDRDEGDDFIEDIVGEVCSSAMKIIYDNYIQKQLLPYTVSQARDALIQIIEVSCSLLVIFFF